MENDVDTNGVETFAQGESSPDKGISARLRIALSGRSVQWLADASGVSHSTIRKYLDGSSPSIEKAAVLARSLGVSLDWLATGEHGRATSAEEPAALDGDLMGRVIDVIDRVYGDLGVRLPRVDLGRLAVERYVEIAKDAEDVEEWPALLDLLGKRLKRSLLAAAADPANIKREA